MEIPLYCVGTTHGKKGLQLYTNTYNFKTKPRTDFQYVPNKSSKIPLYDNSNSIKSGYQHKMMNNSKHNLCNKLGFQDTYMYNIHDVKCYNLICWWHTMQNISKNFGKI